MSQTSPRILQSRLFIFPFLSAFTIGLVACGGSDNEQNPANEEPDLSTESLVNVTGDNSTFDLSAFANAEAERAFDFQEAVVALATTININYCSSTDPLNVDTGNGNVTFTHVDEDPPGLSTNDSHTTTYNNCVQWNRELNGTSSFTVVALVGIPYEPATAWTLTTKAATDLTITAATSQRVVTSNYDFSSSTADGVQFTRSVDGTSLKSSSVNSLVRESSSTFSVLNDWNVTTGAYVKDIDISRTGSFGSRSSVTTTPLAGVSGPPDTGVLVVTNVTPAPVVTSITTYTALGGGNVRVDVDSDGDGVIDTTTETVWDALWGLNFI